MSEFIGDLVTFIGRRIEVARKITRPRLEASAASKSLSEEKATNLNESIKQEVIYLIGLADGLELSRYITTTKKNNLFAKHPGAISYFCIYAPQSLSSATFK